MLGNAVYTKATIIVITCPWKETKEWFMKKRTK